MNSTPSMPACAIWLTVLQPPPPTPITRITARLHWPSTSSNISEVTLDPAIVLPPSIRENPISKMSLQPALQARHPLLDVGPRRGARARRPLLFRKEQQSHAGRVGGTAGDF